MPGIQERARDRKSIAAANIEDPCSAHHEHPRRSSGQSARDLPIGRAPDVRDDRIAIPLKADSSAGVGLPIGSRRRAVDCKIVIMREYDEIAEWYASDRTHPTGVPEVTALAASVPRGARVLDIGCGNGLPITRTLLDAGHHVIELDKVQRNADTISR